MTNSKPLDYMGKGNVADECRRATKALEDDRKDEGIEFTTR
jgi:hypothetical protein